MTIFGYQFSKAPKTTKIEFNGVEIEDFTLNYSVSQYASNPWIASKLYNVDQLRKIKIKDSTFQVIIETFKHGSRKGNITKIPATSIANYHVSLCRKWLDNER